MPRSYVPTLFALKLPEVFSLLALVGTVRALILAGKREIPLGRRAALLLIVLAAVLPPATVVALRPPMYNGIRHFLFILPPLAVLGGLAAAWLADAARAFLIPKAAGLAPGPVLVTALGTMLVVGLAAPVIGMVRLHPYEYTYFNGLAGGVKGARGRYAVDYWGLSLKQASQALLSWIAQRRESTPGGRKWRIAVCGPHRSPEVELGPDFEIRWDPQGADFAMMLGEYYCKIFDAPLVAEVTRAGLVYARVYDIRGRSYGTLLTRPGL
jgi:hypothetical protein